MSTNIITKVSLSVPGGSEASLVHLHEDCLVQCFLKVGGDVVGKELCLVSENNLFCL